MAASIDALIAALQQNKGATGATEVVVPIDTFIAALAAINAGLPAAPSGPATGDLGGNYPNPSVVAIQGQPVSAVAPGNGQTLTFSGGAWKGV